MSELRWAGLERAEARALAARDDTKNLMADAAKLRDAGYGCVITYSPKVFLPLTRLCRDVCHYCTFATTPSRLSNPYLPLSDLIEICQRGEALGCREALLTLGERPEARYSTARRGLAAHGVDSTLGYLRKAAEAILANTGLLPHLNPGTMSRAEIRSLRPVSASMGLMLESTAERLCLPGMPHHGSPDKTPSRRLSTLRILGEEQVATTTGLLIGIGETREERIDTLLAIHDLHASFGHIQEVIVQNFRAKPGTLMSASPEPDLEDLCWTISVARLILGPRVSIQVPPNLSPGALSSLIDAGINDWGGVSPLTPDYVNPEAPWPHLEALGRDTASAGKHLAPRLTIYPAYAINPHVWLDECLHTSVRRHCDSEGYAREDYWSPGQSAIPFSVGLSSTVRPQHYTPSSPLQSVVFKAMKKVPLKSVEIEELFQARGRDFEYVVSAANEARRLAVGDKVTFVVNRNINYTNVCSFHCQFCAFSKGSGERGLAYDIGAEELARRAREAKARGATELCLQGGIHPDYTGQTYLDILKTLRTTVPDLHIHAFSPLEVLQGARTLGVSPREFLLELKASGLGSMPGTAAEILHDDVRKLICADKLSAREWVETVREAHQVGIPTTSTIMFGHVDSYAHWAAHLIEIRELQRLTGGITEFVPLPFVATEAPIYRRGKSRRGPTARETALMHAVARLVFLGLIDNIQASWVKLGLDGVAACLEAGANDLGGTLMNESITRAAGASHGEEVAPAEMRRLISSHGREAEQRTTLYAAVELPSEIAVEDSFPLNPVENAAAGKLHRSKVLAKEGLCE